MADAVSKLYAEIGFKVNEEGLKQAQKMLAEFAKQMSELNELTKRQASLYGFFSKERAKQDTEREKQATEQKKAETQRIKQSLKETTHQQQMERMARKDEMQEKRFRQKEQEHMWRMEERSQKRHSNNMVREMKRSVGVMTRVARNSVKMLASATKGPWKNVFLPNLSNSFNVRNFMMYTGTNLATLQGIQERFASVGSPMSREDIMGELSSVMENITKIRFGEGKLSGYKLGGIQAFAAKGNVSKVLDMIENATVGVDNQALVELLNQMGFTGQQWLPYFRARQRVNKELPRLDEKGQEKLLDANASLQTFVLGLQRSGEILTSKFSPVIKSFSDKMIDFLNVWLSNINVEKVGQVIDRLTDKFTKWLDSISIEDIEEGITRFWDAVKQISDGIEWLAHQISAIRGAKSAVNNIKSGNKQGAVFDLIGAYLEHKGVLGKTVVINNNQQTTTNVNADSTDKIAELIEKATENGVSAGTDKSTSGSYVDSVFVGVF